jgi:hypothetical protein
MLAEFKKVRQDINSFRRLFTDRNFDLYIWYRCVDSTEIIGFQLVYNSGMEQKALTWQKDSGFCHLRIDEGDRGFNKTPILVKDGAFEYPDVRDRLLASIRNVDTEIRDFVVSKIDEYGEQL